MYVVFLNFQVVLGLPVIRSSTAVRDAASEGSRLNIPSLEWQESDIRAKTDVSDAKISKATRTLDRVKQGL